MRFLRVAQLCFTFKKIYYIYNYIHFFIDKIIFQYNIIINLDKHIQLDTYILFKNNKKSANKT